jgi:hypothetical protein
MWKQIAWVGLAALTLAGCSDDRGTYVYRPTNSAATGGGASQGNAANDELRGGLPAGAEVGGANAGPRTSSGFGLAPGR